jgi:hypothetical protein
MAKPDYDYTIRDGHRVRLQEQRYNKEGKPDGIEPSYGY